MVAVSLKKNFFKQKTAYEITTRLVGSEMCIRDRYMHLKVSVSHSDIPEDDTPRDTYSCLLYTSDAADD